MHYRLGVVGMAALLVAAGCTVTKVPEPTRGIESEGVVELAYEYGGFEKPEVDWDRADAAALERCAAWGYTDARQSVRSKHECIDFSGGGCMQWHVSVTYECLGSADSD